MTYFLLALMILSFGTLHAQIGGMDSVGLAMPAYAILAVAAGASLFIRQMPKARPSSACLWSSAFFFGYILIRALCSPVPYLARQDLFMVVAALIVYLLTAFFLVSTKSRLIVGGAFLLLLVGNVAVGLIQFKEQNNFMLFDFGRADYGPRASGLFTVPNQLPGFLNVVVVFGLAVTLWGKVNSTPKLLIAYLSILGLAGVILSGSRGGYLAGIAGLIAIATLSIYPLRRAYPYRFWRLVIMGAVAAAVLATIGAFAIQKSQYLSKRTRQVYEPSNMRVHLWDSAIQQFQLNPLLGTGSGTFRIYARKFRDPSVQTDPIHVHNDYLELLAEYGALGALGFLAFLGVHLTVGVRAYREIVQTRLSPKLSSSSLAFQIGALGAVSVYLVHSIFDFNLHIPANTMLMAFVFGVLANPGVRMSSRTKDRRWALTPWSRFALPALGLCIFVFGVRLWPGEYFAFQARMEDDKRERENTIRYAELSLQWDDGNPFAYYYLGQAYGALGYRNRKEVDGGRAYFKKAVSAYNGALCLFPDDVVTQANLAWVLDRLKDYDMAEQKWQFVLELDPNFADYLAYYGEHLGEMDHYYRARDYFLKSLALKENEVATIGLEEMNEVIKILETDPVQTEPDTAAAY